MRRSIKQYRRFVTGLGFFTPFEVAGRLATIGLCLLVGVASAAELVQGSASLQAVGVLVVCLVVTLGLFAIVVRAGEIEPF